MIRVIKNIGYILIGIIGILLLIFSCIVLILILVAMFLDGKSDEELMKIINIFKRKKNSKLLITKRDE